MRLSRQSLRRHAALLATTVSWHICNINYSVFSRPKAYLRNGRAYGTSCRLSVRLSVVCHGYIVAKRCEIGRKWLLITNRKSHTGFQMTQKSLTLDNLDGMLIVRYCG